MSGDQEQDEVRLPWWPEPRERPQREPLARDQIVATAIRVADTEGLGALSMRRLADELGSGATSIYRHVANKDELLDLAVDQILGEVPNTDDPTIGWDERVATLARAVRETLQQHPGIALLLGSRVTRGPNALSLADRLLGILRSAGIGGVQLGLAYQIVFDWAVLFGFMGGRQMSPAGGDGQTPEQQQEILAAMVAALPRDRYPNIVSMFDHADELTADAQFEFGLRALIAGIAAVRSKPAGK